MQNYFAGEPVLRIVAVQDGFEEGFWKFVNQDFLDYYFFIFDWKHRREQTRILLALENSQIQGLMLLYANEIVQLRGSKKAVESLLDVVNLENVELQAPVECEEMVLRKYRAGVKHIVVLMSLKKGEENLLIKHALVKLNMDNVGEIVEVMRKADPESWGDLSQAKRHWQDACLLGIRRNDKLVSIGLTRFVDFGSNISAIATDENYRNMGFATSIVSALVQEILKNSSMAIIYVLKDNMPAVRVYTRVGFKPAK
jgi:ribosomal protein S18 acetylase RimI-like enzyme